MKKINITPLELIKTPGAKIAVIIPQNFSIDQLAAGLAMSMVLKKLEHSVVVLSATQPRVGDSRLFDIDQLTSNVPSENFVITLTNAVSKLKRVKHFVDGDDLKFMLFPRDNASKFEASEITHGYEATGFDMIVIIGQDAQNALARFPQLAHTNCPTVVISKNPAHAHDQSLSIIDQDAKSVSEIVARIIESAQIPAWEDLAFNIFQGISAATNNFSVSLVTPGVLETATWAVENGASQTALSVETKPFTPQNQQPHQQSSDRQYEAGRGRDSRDRSRSRDGRDRRGSDQGRQFDSRSPRENINVPQQTPSRSPSPNLQQSASEESSQWADKPKIYQGSTIVDTEIK